MSAASDTSRPGVRRGPSGRMMLALAVATALVLVGGCRPPAERADARRIEVRLLDEVPRVGHAVIEVAVWNHGATVDTATVRVTGDMTHAGMVPVIGDAQLVAPGTYQTSGFALTMAGDWLLTVDVTFPDAVTRQATLPVRVAR